MTKDEATKVLRDDLKPGDTINCILRHVSKSGMSRSISLFKGDSDITYFAALAMGEKIDQKNGGIVVSGCGMDMGFHIVYTLSYLLFPDGFGLEGEFPLGRKIRPTSKENAAEAVKRGARFFGRNRDNSGWEIDGGYALRHRWL
jgi:hypothetical protein